MESENASKDYEWVYASAIWKEQGLFSMAGVVIILNSRI